EIYARKMRRDFTKFEIDIEEFASNKMIEELKTKYNSLYDEMELLQKRYDSETDHGAGSQAQIDWEEWIDVQLKMTNAYSKMNHETTSH
ncbi:MAG: hypothetical protein ACI84C_001515, partial [Flavobacteriales bacterium]